MSHEPDGPQALGRDLLDQVTGGARRMRLALPALPGANLFTKIRGILFSEPGAPPPIGQTRAEYLRHLEKSGLPMPWEEGANPHW